jgi:UDP-glucose 4,6-dehydratase
VIENGTTRIARDLTTPDAKKIVAEQPSKLAGFLETDPPNFSFRSPPCSFYSGTKALGEEVMNGVGQGYLWRLRIPFDEFDNPRNYLTKVQSYAKVYDNVNSISHRTDFVRACLDLWNIRAPFGTYNVTNPGWITTRHVIAKIQEILKTGKHFEFWADDTEFYKFAKAPRSNCILDINKLLGAGIKIRPVDEALTDSLRNWRRAA